MILRSTSSHSHIHFVASPLFGWNPTGHVQGRNWMSTWHRDNLASLHGPSAYRINVSDTWGENTLNLRILQESAIFCEDWSSPKPPRIEDRELRMVALTVWLTWSIATRDSGNTSPFLTVISVCCRLQSGSLSLQKQIWTGWELIVPESSIVLTVLIYVTPSITSGLCWKFRSYLLYTSAYVLTVHRSSSPPNRVDPDRWA